MVCSLGRSLDTTLHSPNVVIKVGKPESKGTPRPSMAEIAAKSESAQGSQSEFATSTTP